MDNVVLNKKKVFIRVISFTLIFSILFVFVSYLLRPVGYGRTIINGYYAERKNSLDTVYIGGSVCFVSWAPLIAFREQGIASHNYACDTIQADTLKYAINDVLKTQSPKMLIIDTRPFEYRDVEQPPAEVPIRNISDSMPYSLNRTKMLLNIVPSVLHGDSFEYLFDIVKYHNRWESLGETSFDFAFNKKEDDLKGFAFMASHATLTKPTNIATIKEKLAPSKETDKILTDLLEYCKSKNLHVLFVVAPYQEKDIQRKIYNYTSDRIKSYGFDFVNFNDYYSQIGIDFSTDFYNNDHLNIFGAEKYTKFLAKYITDNYKIPDRRDDPQYADWYKLMPNWDGSVAQLKQTILNLNKKNKQ